MHFHPYPQGPPAQERTCAGPSEVCQLFREELGESIVVRWDQNLWHQLNSPCLKEEEWCPWPQVNHSHRKKWRWKYYVLGMFSAKGTGLHHIKGTKDGSMYRQGPGHWSQPGHWKWVMDGYSSMTMTQNTRPRQQRSGSRRSTLRSWSGIASLWKSVEGAEDSICQT